MKNPDEPKAPRDGKLLRARFFELIAEGKSSNFAAKEVGISNRSRTRFLQERRQAGLAVEPVYPVEDIKKFSDNGHKVEDIATRFSLTPRKVREIAKQNGIKFATPSTPSRPVTKLIDLAEVKRWAAEGLSRSGIATTMNIDRHRMHDFIRDNNIEINWNKAKLPVKPNTLDKKAAEEQRKQDYNELVRTTQKLLLEGKSIPDVAALLDKGYDFMYRLVRNNDLRQPNFVVPIKFRSISVTHTVGKQIVQRDTSMAGDRECINCRKVFRSWHRAKNQRCEHCRQMED